MLDFYRTPQVPKSLPFPFHLYISNLPREIDFGIIFMDVGREGQKKRGPSKLKKLKQPMSNTHV